MALTLLQMVTQFCERKNISIPSTVIGSTDPQVVQIRALLEKEGIELARRGDWEGITFQATHTTTAAEDQGTITSIAGAGFKYIKNQTIWDRTDSLPVLGPASASEWQALKALAATSPRYTFRIRGGKLLVDPVPAAGHSWAFEYVSRYWIVATGATTATKALFTVDTDFPALPDEILTLGLEWRWKAEKGLDYAEDFRSYEMMVKDALGRDGGKPILRMDDGRGAPKPGVFVPSGSWNV